MVGRGGRSKACFTCRRRRLKCDERLPGCLRCERLSQTCPGYPPAICFINYELPDGRKSQRRRSIAFTRSTAKPVETLSQITTVPQALNPIHDGEYITYLHGFFVATSSGEWPGFTALQSPGSLSFQCLRSFAASFFGRRNDRRDVTIKGLSSYSNSLSTLQSSLQHQPTVEDSYQIALAITILYLCECLTGTTAKGWKDHMLGFMAVLEAKGPSFFSLPGATHLFESVRFSILLAYMFSKKATPLATEMYKRTPWSSHNGSPKSAIQQFLDEATAIPGMQETYKHYLEVDDDGTKRSLGSQLDTQLPTLYGRFHQWRQNWDHDQRDLEGIPASTDGSFTKSCSEADLQYPATAEKVDTLATYDTTLIILLELWKSFHHSSRCSESQLMEDKTIRSSLEEALEEEERRAAVELCRSINSHIWSSGTIANSISLIVPIRMALVALHGRDQERTAWLQNLMGKVSSHSGWEVGRFTMENLPGWETAG